MEDMMKKRARNFYGLETYLNFPRLNKEGNPDLRIFAKKSEVHRFLNSPPDGKTKRIGIGGIQALNFGKRTDWRPAGILENLRKWKAGIEIYIHEFRKNGRMKIGVSPALTWCGGGHPYALPYPLNVKSIMCAMSNYSKILFDKRPESLPAIKFECRITGAFNLADFINGNDCQTEFFFADLPASEFFLEKQSIKC